MLPLPKSPNPILLELGPLTVRWYGLLLAAGVLAGFLLVRRTARGLIRGDALADLALWVVVAGFVGARLYHVLNEPSYYIDHPGEIVAVWNGGLAIHGGLLAGAVTAWLWARKHRVGWLALLDVLAPGVALGQAVGRWGNFFNQELFGGPTSLPWGMTVDTAHRPAGFESVTSFHPTFLYESLGDLLIVAALLLIRRRWRGRHDGDLALVYLAATSMVRFGTELLRIDRVPIVLGARLPLLVAGALVLATSTLLILRHAQRTPDHRP